MKADDPKAKGSLEEDAMTGESDRVRQQERLKAAQNLPVTQRDGWRHRSSRRD